MQCIYGDEMAWSGNIVLNDGHEIKDISVHKDHLQKDVFPNQASLRFLSIVETSRIPLYLALGPPCSVSTSNLEAQRWFSPTLLAAGADTNSKDESPWWRKATLDSPFGILASIELPNVVHAQTKPHATEVLFYASHKPGLNQAPPTPPNSSPDHGHSGSVSDGSIQLELRALVLSSDLLRCSPTNEPTPPSSPKDEPVEPVFLPNLLSSDSEIINEPPVRKRKTANDAFDEANERRKKARRKGGEGVAAAAASKAEKQMPSLQHRRSASAIQPVPLQTRPLSRSPSVVSSRPTTANRPSTLSKMENSTEVYEESAIERKNKDIISRVVMTGMRLHGLTQNKKRNMQDSRTAPSPALDDGVETAESQQQNDGEYKLIYHQVFKGTCVAFRATIRRENLQPFSVQIRDVVDQLLVILCTNPLENGLGQLDDEWTPGGRKAFASGSAQEIEHSTRFPKR